MKYSNPRILFIQLGVIVSFTIVFSLSIYAQAPVEVEPTPSEATPPPSEATQAETHSGLEPASVLLDRVQQYYAKASDFTSDFRQTYTYHIYGRQKISTGKVYFKKPSRMRWDYEIPTRRVFVADGATLWVYEPDEAQVFKRDLSSAQLPVALRFMRGEGKLSSDFNVEDVQLGETPESASITLKPKTPSPDFTHLKLVIKQKTGEVIASILTDPTENTNRIDFVDVKVNQDLPDSGFSFSPPEGVRVIEDLKRGTP